MRGFTPRKNFGVDWVAAAGDCAAVADFGDSACGALARAEFLWREGGRDRAVACCGSIDGSRAAGEEEGGRDGDVARWRAGFGGGWAARYVSVA